MTPGIDRPIEASPRARTNPGAAGGAAAAMRARAAGTSGYGSVARAALFWSYLRNVVYSVVAIPTTIILARLLAPSDFGVAAAATFFGQLAARLSSAGMGVALIRVKTLRDDHVSTVFAVTVLMNLAAFAALVFGAPLVGAFYRSEDVAKVMPFVGLNFLIAGVFTVPRALLSRDLRYKELSASSTLDMFVASATACVLAWWGWGYWSLITGEIAGATANGVLTWSWTRWRPSLWFSRAAFGDLFSFGMGSYFKKLVDHAALNIDNLIVGRLLGMAALGFYDKGFSAGNKLYSKLTVVGPSVSFRIFSIIQDEPERFRRGYRKVILSTTLMGYPVFAALAALAHPLFLLAFGERWLPSVLPFQILCVAFMLKLTNTYAGSAAQARGWIWSQVWRHGVNVVALAAGVYVLSPWGIIGAALAVLGATIVLWVLMQNLLRTATHFGWRDILEPQVPAVLCSAGVAGVALGAGFVLERTLAQPSPWIVLPVQAALAGLFYLGFLRFSGFREVTALVAETLEQISPRLAGMAGLRQTAPGAAESKTI